MKDLSPNWLTEGLLDPEYKRYQLLAWLQQVEQQFAQVKLYPWFNDLLFHYRNLQQVRQNHQLIYEQFPKELTRADFARLKLVYTQLIEDDSFMRSLEEIISFSLPQLQRWVNEGRDIYNFVEENVSISPVGLTAINKDEGYFFLLAHPFSQTDIYRYQITIFEGPEDRYRAINVVHLETQPKSRLQTFESLKVELIRRQQSLPNPATWLVEARVAAPRNETLLPVVKRRLVQYILTAA